MQEQTSPMVYSFAVFPFLKTSRPVNIGQLTFRSTDDTYNLTDEQAASLEEIAGMLFLQDNLQIKAASYAVTPFVDLTYAPTGVDHLMNVQAFLAYLYASPRHEFGDLFLSSEHASMAIFTPGPVSVHIVRPSANVDEVEPASELVPNDREEVDGYAGIYNFRHHFWVARGSRLYGPRPHLTLKDSQDLSIDLDRAAQRTDFRLLARLLRKPETKTSSRIFNAVQWFNAANNTAKDDGSAAVDLSIAFEALLGLPAGQKTDRLTDAISLLVGRVPRLDIWARQFYRARSQVVHEGQSEQLRFVATDSQKVMDGPQYQSLLSYGRQIFQFCVGTLLTGAEFAENAGLEEKLVTNQERFQDICQILTDTSIEPRERLERVRRLVSAIQQYRYIPETGLSMETMIGATRHAARVYLETGATPPELDKVLEGLVAARRTTDHFQELDALQALERGFKDNPLAADMKCGFALRDIVEVVWSYTFMHYFWLKKRNSADQ